MVKTAKTIAYSDGDIEGRIIQLMKKAASLSSDVDIAPEEYSSWPVEYHLSSSRPNCLRHLDFSGLDVLEFGAGMGAVSRYLAEHCRSLTAVEGAERRFQALSERLRDLSNWNGALVNYQDFVSDKKYDLVCFCGVLEYAGRYIEKPEPFKWALNHARSFLKDGGAVLVLIENKNGFKYLAGAAEDHYGRHYDGFCGYGLKDDIKTFSLLEMRRLFEDVGLGDVETQHLWPDYKLAQAVLTDDLVAGRPDLCAAIAAAYGYRDYEGRDKALFPYNLGLASLAASGLLREFSNSYLFLASAGEGGRVKRHLLQPLVDERIQASLYTSLRKYNVTTVFKAGEKGLMVEKKPRDKPHPEKVEGGGISIDLSSRQTDLVSSGRGLLHILTSHLYYNNEAGFYEALHQFFDYAFSRFGTDDANLLEGRAFDALIHNALQSDQGLEVFDFEYEYAGGLSKSYFIFRNLSVLSRYLRFSRLKNTPTAKGLYEKLCADYGFNPQWEADRQTEAAVQRLLYNSAAPGGRIKFHYRLMAALLPVKSWRKKVRRLGLGKLDD